MTALISITFLLQLLINPQPGELTEIRRLYARAPLFKADAQQFNKLLLSVDSSSAPVLCCYKGAAEMIAAKYAINPIIKLQRFNAGKAWISAAVKRDTLALEMRFVRFSIQSNLPVFLGYREDIGTDKDFLLRHVRNCADPELKKMIINYITVSAALTAEELKQFNK